MRDEETLRLHRVIHIGMKVVASRGQRRTELVGQTIKNKESEMRDEKEPRVRRDVHIDVKVVTSKVR